MGASSDLQQCTADNSRRSRRLSACLCSLLLSSLHPQRIPRGRPDHKAVRALKKLRIGAHLVKEGQVCVVVSPTARQLLHRVPACCCVANCTSSVRRELCEVSLPSFPHLKPYHYQGMHYLYVCTPQSASRLGTPAGLRTKTDMSQTDIFSQVSQTDPRIRPRPHRFYLVITPALSLSTASPSMRIRS